MPHDPDLAIGVEIRGVYDGISIWLYPDGRIVNQWASGDWAGSTRWAATEDYIEKHLAWLNAVLREQFPLPDTDELLGADGGDQQRDTAEDG